MLMFPPYVTRITSPEVISKLKHITEKHDQMYETWVADGRKMPGARNSWKSLYFRDFHYALHPLEMLEEMGDNYWEHQAKIVGDLSITEMKRKCYDPWFRETMNEEWISKADSWIGSPAYHRFIQPSNAVKKVIESEMTSNGLIDPEYSYMSFTNIYRPYDYIGWHTNHSTASIRIMLLYVEEKNSSWFNYIDPVTEKFVSQLDPQGWSLRIADFGVPRRSLKGNLYGGAEGHVLWHSVWSTCSRYSYGIAPRTDTNIKKQNCDYSPTAVFKILDSLKVTLPENIRMRIMGRVNGR